MVLLLSSCVSSPSFPECGDPIEYTYEEPIIFLDLGISVTCIEEGTVLDECHGNSTFRRFLISDRNDQTEVYCVTSCVDLPYPFEINDKKYVLYPQPNEYHMSDNKLVILDEDSYLEYEDRKMRHLGAETKFDKELVQEVWIVR